MQRIQARALSETLNPKLHTTLSYVISIIEKSVIMGRDGLAICIAQHAGVVIKKESVCGDETTTVHSKDKTESKTLLSASQEAVYYGRIQEGAPDTLAAVLQAFKAVPRNNPRLLDARWQP